MSVARRFAAALLVVGTGVLAYAVPASATGSESEGGQCITNPTEDQLVAHLYPRQGIARVRAVDGVDLCADVLLSIYRVPETWDGRDFNASAVPQTLLTTARGKVEGTDKLELTVPVPDCGALQIDLYFPPEVTEVTGRGHDGQLIQGLGYLWRWYESGKPKQCTPPAEETTSPPPAEETTTPPPAETTTPPPAEETTTPPPPQETTTAVPPTQPIAGPIIKVPSTPPVRTPPVLAETGSDSTVPLLGLGIALLGAGIGLSLLGRRRAA